MLTLGHALQALGGDRAAANSGGPLISGGCVDSRAVQPGMLFVALAGAHLDGHDFVGEAFAKGATVALVQRAVNGPWPVLDLTRGPLPAAAACPQPVCLQVPDTLLALQTIAAYWRGKCAVRVVGITGSVGKSSTKEATATVLAQRFRTLKNTGNQNNEIGLPLTLLQLSSAHERAVLEMGFYVAGEITQLCNLAQPQVGVITNVYAVHAERAGSLADIARGKRELLDALPAAPDGVAVLNADEPLVMEMAAHTRARIVTYGMGEAAQLRASALESYGLDGIGFQLEHAGQHLPVRVPLIGRHSVYTALRAIAVGVAEGMPATAAAAALAQPQARDGLRLKPVPGLHGSLILDDSYNASPESAVAALDLLAELDAVRHIAVLGDMRELGAYERAGHDLVGRHAGARVQLLVTVGQRARWIAAAARAGGLAAGATHEFETVEAATEFLRMQLRTGDVALVKGSLAMHLDGMVRQLANKDE
ncbi:MAG: UDP-N-acetylmuramoyl-tripeptide--D-alanyl-D-alanine ligase [Chloroflexi bacterium]|nr:MAG: UDP-N-acetylmuramoyl-tripeptide--D-alanyl-D-alanine ligase [Chloroflexota bacterium]